MNMLGSRARWAVLWISNRNGTPTVIERDFEQDLAAAVDLYGRAKAAGKSHATLLCRNVSFPPPAKYLPRRELRERQIGTKTVVKRNKKTGKRRRVQVPHIIPQWVELEPMRQINAKGIMWCPYCREFRRPQAQDGFRYGRAFVEQPAYHCPICTISNNDGAVQRYNPGYRRRTPKRKRVRKRGTR